MPNKSIHFIYLLVKFQNANKLMYFIYHFLPGKILPGKNLKTLFFYQILFEQYFKISGWNSSQWQMPNKSINFIYLLVKFQNVNKLIHFIYLFVLGKILPDTFLKILIFCLNTIQILNLYS